MTRPHAPPPARLTPRPAARVNPVSPSTVVPRGRAAQLLAGLLRFIGLWAAISGAYAVMGGTCPFCGSPACPVGLGVAGIFGALGSLILTQGRRLFAAIRSGLTDGRR